MSETETKPTSNFIRHIIDEDISNNKNEGKAVTRFGIDTIGAFWLECFILISQRIIKVAYVNWLAGVTDIYFYSVSFQFDASKWNIC